MASEVAVSLKGVGKRFKLYNKRHHRIREILSLGKRNFHRDFWALKDIDLEVKRGEALGIIGANGAGKTTLLQIIAGILDASEGKVKVYGRVGALLDLGACFPPEYSGEQNIRFFAKLLGHSNREIERHFSGIVKFADIGDFIKQPVSTYSQGMFLRLAFATAITIKPDIILIDEVLAVGDFGFRNKCYEAIRNIMENSTFILVTHDLNAVKTMAPTTAVIKDGRVDYIGPTDVAVDKYHLETIQSHLQQSDVEKSEANFVDQRIESFSMEVYNEQGKQTSQFKWGELFKCLINFEFNDAIPLDEAVLDFHVRTVEGICVCGIKMDLSEKGIKAFGPKKPFSISFHLESKFLPGSYFITLLLKETRGTPKFIYVNGRACRISVLPSESHECVGLVEWPISYEIL